MPLEIWNSRTRLLAAALHLLAIGFALTFSLSARSQSASTPSPTTGTVPVHYLSAGALPGNTAQYFTALGPELNLAGSERIVLTGTLTDATGSSPITITRQLDQAIRIDIGGSSPQTLIAANLLGTVAATASLSSEGASLLETVLDDSPEGFLYGFLDGVSYRWLGSQYRTDDGTTPNYTGPFYDVYVRASTPSFLPGASTRQKQTLLDDATSFYTSSRYTASNSGGSQTQVVVTYSNWTVNSSGQAVPGTITRTENGAQVFSIQITSKASAPQQQDGLFTIPTTGN